MSFNDLFKPEEQENPLFKTVPKTFTQTVTTNILKNTSNKNSGNTYRSSYTGTNLGMGDSTYAPKTTNPSPPKSYTASETKKKDTFLEGFYSVADKPKDERRSYNPSPYAKSRAMLDSMTQAKREEEDDFLKGFYSVADRPKEETPISAYLQTIRQNMQTPYKPGDWMKRTANNLPLTGRIAPIKEANPSSIHSSSSPMKNKTKTEESVVEKFSNNRKEHGTINAISRTLNEYGMLDETMNGFMKSYDFAQSNQPFFNALLPQPNFLNTVIPAAHAIIGELNYMQNDGFAPVGGETRSYLNEQKTGIIPSLRYGVGTMDENGCGMMAVYNSLKTLGDHEDLKTINRRFENRGQIAFGKWGTNPYEIGDFFKQRGYDVKVFEGEKITERNIPYADTYILTHTNSSNILDGVHIVSLTRLDDGTYAVYNSDDAWWGGPEIANSIDDYLNRTKRKAVASDKETEPYVGLSLHCISKKRR